MFSTQQYFGFDPRTIPGCRLWLDAADSNTVTIATGVSQWNDKSGNGFNFSQATTGRQPTYNTNALNGRNAIEFTGTNVQGSATRVLDNASFTLSNSNYSIFAVARQNASALSYTGYNYVLKGSLTTDYFLFFGNTGNGGTPSANKFFATFTGPSNAWNDLTSNTPAVSTLNNPLVMGMTVSNTVLTPYYNGITQNTKTGTTGAFTGMRLGDAPETLTGQNWNGIICEICIYNSVLTTSERQQLEGYLAWKWGLQANLPTAHSFKSNPTTMRIFQPIDISGCSLWLDAADSSTFTFSSGSNVSQWRDKSGNGRHASNATSSSQPVLESNRLNGLPALKWDGANDRLDGSLPYPTNGQSTLFILYEITSSTGVDRRVFDINGNSYGNFGSPQGGLNAEVVLWLAGASYPTNALYTQTAPSLGWKLYAVNYNGTSSLVWRFGTSMALSGSGANTTPTGTTYTLGNSAFGNDSTPFDGRIGELIFYSGNLTTSQRQQVEGYLAAKWGLSGSLPTTQPYYLQRALPSTPLFVPSTLSNLGLWLDGADSSTITLSAGTSNVTEWRDKSGNSRHATGLTSKWTTYPTGANYVQFTAANNSVLSCPGMNVVVNTQYTFFTVYRRDNPPTNPNHPNIQFFCGGSDGTTNTRLHIGYESSTSMKYAQWANQYSVTVPALTSPEPINVWGFMQTSNQRIMYLNGTIPSGGTNANSSLVSAQNGGVIGAYQSDPFYSLDGRLYEFVIFTRALSTTERQQMEGYLAWKYGAQTNLPTTHPYYKFRP